jgi:hypothetical protein
MHRRFAAGLGLALVSIVAPAVARAADPAPLGDLEGYYRANGITVERAAGVKRPLSGVLIVAPAREGRGWDLRFSFKTQISTPDGSVRADLIGTGDGLVERGELRGHAETQVIWAAIPGVDPQFAFIPGRLGPRIQSTFSMRPGDDADAFRGEVETVAAPGFEYAATRSTMRLERISREAPQDERLPLPKPRSD